MGNSRFIFALFLILVCAQLFVPTKMIWDREAIITDGKMFKFRTAPVDPTDLFRGKYVFLNYAENLVKVDNNDGWDNNQTAYVSLDLDENGFAIPKSISTSPPQNIADYTKVTTNYLIDRENGILQFNYLFNRFYMEESKAPKAEKLYNERQRDSNSITYAVVYIKNGEAVLTDLVIDGISISKLVEEE